MAWHGMGTCVKVITTLELPSPVRPSLLALHLPQGASPAPVRQKQRRRSAAAKSNQRQKASDEPLLLGESRLRQPAKRVARHSRFNHRPLLCFWLWLSSDLDGRLSVFCHC